MMEPYDLDRREPYLYDMTAIPLTEAILVLLSVHRQV